MNLIIEKTKRHLDNIETALFNLARFFPLPFDKWQPAAEVKRICSDLERAIRLSANQKRCLIRDAIELREKGIVSVDQWLVQTGGEEKDKIV